jgi:hypothetical protein
MAFLYQVDIPNWKDANHESLLDKMNPTRELMPGLLEIITAETETGLRVLQVWETQEQAETFGKIAAGVFKGLGAEDTRFQGFVIEHLYR